MGERALTEVGRDGRPRDEDVERLVGLDELEEAAGPGGSPTAPPDSGQGHPTSAAPGGVPEATAAGSASSADELGGDVDRPPTSPPGSSEGRSSADERGPRPQPGEAFVARRRRGPSAADITEERMLRASAEPPASGWRRMVHRVTGGLITPSPPEAELERRRRIGTLKTPVAGSRVIATVSTKGGVGKTTTTVNLGHTFATHRGDRVVALDGNPDAGSLGYRIRLETAATAADLLAGAEAITRYADLCAFTSQAPSRLEVVAAPDDPECSTALDADDYGCLLDLLEHHYQLLLVDCGTGILDSATQGVVSRADQLVVVTGASLDAARATSYLLDWLDKHGRSRLVAEAVAVINAVPDRPGLVEVDEVASHFAARCRAVVPVPWDRQLAAGAQTSLGRLEPATNDAYVRLAAAVAEGFTGEDSGFGLDDRDSDQTEAVA